MECEDRVLLSSALLRGQVIKYPSERRDVGSLKMWVKSVAGTA